jgi:sugar lactone lactonase YvrE
VRDAPQTHAREASASEPMSTATHRFRLGLWALVSACALAVPSTATARLEVSVFAHVPAPGYPANALVAADGTVYAGTFHSFTASSDNGPSKVFAFSPSGQLERSYTITGQTPQKPHGVQVAATDRSGTLYLLDQDPARVLKLDPKTGQQSTWATFASVPACVAGQPAGACTDGPGGSAPEPDFAAWGPDGSLYVTDFNQALIWRIPPNGGAAKVWLTDPSFNGTVAGPAGIELLSDGRTLMFDTGAGGTDPATGKLYTVSIESGGRPGPLRQLWESAPAEAPDGFAVARSGDVYVALVGPFANAVVELSPQGQEVARVPANPVANALSPVPFDAPGSVTFDGQHVLVANQSVFAGNTADMALLEIAVGETGLPVSLPPPGPAQISYRLKVRPHSARRDKRTRFTFTALERTGGAWQAVAGALIRFSGHTTRTGANGRAKIVATLRRPGRRYRAVLVVAGHRRATVRIIASRSRGRR